MEEEFKTLYLGKWPRDDEYEHYLKLWIKYRKETEYLSRSQERDAHEIHKRLFGDLPKNEKYQQAKVASIGHQICRD